MEIGSGVFEKMWPAEDFEAPKSDKHDSADLAGGVGRVCKYRLGRFLDDVIVLIIMHDNLCTLSCFEKVLPLSSGCLIWV